MFMKKKLLRLYPDPCEKVSIKGLYLAHQLHKHALCLRQLPVESGRARCVGRYRSPQAYNSGLWLWPIHGTACAGRLPHYPWRLSAGIEALYYEQDSPTGSGQFFIQFGMERASNREGGNLNLTF